MGSRSKYLNFDLVIEESGDRYRAHVTHSPGGEGSVEFDKPFSELELENFVLRMGQSRSGMRSIDSSEMQAAKGLGQHLFTTVFSGEVNSCYLRSVDQVGSQNKGLRVRLHINVPEFNNLPWEFLYDPQFERFVSMSENTPIIRYLELPHPTRPLPVQAPLKILAMISSPKEYPKLDVQKEWETLNQALKPLLDRKSVLLERLEHPTLGTLQKKLRQDKVHIFHFIGHGKFFEDKQDGMLLLEDEKGNGRPTSGQYLGTILQDHYPLRLVVLNACEGARTSTEDPYSGVAQTLVRQGIPAVLAMQFVIFETAAMIFAKEFYSAIVDNYPVDAALSEARKAIFTNDDGVEWGTPVLFMRAPDGVLFQPESEEDRAARLEAEREKQERLNKESAERIAGKKAEKEALEKVEREPAEKAARDRMVGGVIKEDKPLPNMTSFLSKNWKFLSLAVVILIGIVSLLVLSNIPNPLYVASFGAGIEENDIGQLMGVACPQGGCTDPDILRATYEIDDIDETHKGVLRLEYVIENWSSFWIELGNVNLDPYNKLSFDVRSDNKNLSNEEFKVEFIRENDRAIKYFSGISTEWNTIELNLADFYNPGYGDEIKTWEYMDQLVFTFEKEKSGEQGVIFLDNIRFLP